jgi:hypothetical protein
MIGTSRRKASFGSCPGSLLLKPANAPRARDLQPQVNFAPRFPRLPALRQSPQNQAQRISHPGYTHKRSRKQNAAAGRLAFCRPGNLVYSLVVMYAVHYEADPVVS